MNGHVAQNNFTAGELSEWLDARVDFAKYNNGLTLCQNAIVRPQGGAFGRGGFVHVTFTKYADKITRLIPFRFSKTQAYQLEFGDKYIRIFKNHAPVTITTTISNCSLGASGKVRVTTSAAHGFLTGWTVTVSGVGGTTEANGVFTITKIDDTNFDLEGTAFVHAYTSGGSATGIVEVATAYEHTDLRDIKYAQSADTLYLAHEEYEPGKITRTSETDWDLNAINFIDGPYFDENISAVTMQASATTGAITITASAAFFEPGHIGALMRIKGTNWGYAEITGFQSPTKVNATVIDALDTTAAVTAWREGMWSEKAGYPSCVTIHEQRSVWGGSTEAPQTIVGSVSDSYEDMTPGAADDDSYVFTVGSEEINTIRWLSTSEALVIGTEGGEFSVTGEGDKGITPTSIRIKARTPHGSGTIRPIRVSDSILFVQRSGRKVRSLAYQLTADSFQAKDLGLLADHLLEPHGVSDMIYQQEPWSVVWIVRDDGKLIGVTFMADQEITAWHQHPTYADAAFQSVSSIPSSTFDRDEPWVICLRNLNGVNKQSIEYYDQDNPGLDCAKVYSGASTSTITASHLVGMTVAIVGDGAVFPSQTVPSTGIITLSKACTSIRVGLPFVGKLRTVKPEIQLPGGGTSQGLKRRWINVRCRVRRAMGLIIAGEQIPYRKSTDPMGTPVAAYTGDHVIMGPHGWDLEGIIEIEQPVPLPWAVTGIFGKLDIGVD